MIERDDSSEQAPGSPESTYHARCARFEALRDHYNRRSYRNANLSLALIIAALVCLGLWLWRGDPALIVATVLLGVGFVISFLHHGRVDRLHARYADLWTINREGLWRLRRDWASLPLRQPPLSQAEDRPADAGALDRAYADDLDLLGHASLQHLLGVAYTPVGQATLRHRLLNPAPPDVVRRRQVAVIELAPLIDLRDELALRGRRMGSSQPGYERFLDWAESAPWLVQRPWLRWLAYVLPVMTLALLAAQVLGVVAYPLWLAGIVAGLVLTLTIGRRVDVIIDQVAARQSVFQSYADLFGLIKDQPFVAPDLRRLQADLSAGDLRADQQMRRLGRIMPLADLRGWMFFYPIQCATLWNVHVLWLLERWQRTAGSHARGWLMTIGELEALVALATLAYDHPSWAFPTFVADERPVLTARDLGHPLLPPPACVGNDIRIGPPGMFLLVTGSNMSGKSTLLRAIGVNVVLAQAGGPVCAAHLSMPPITLATSMRVQDSLEYGVSYFMAELKRLKSVVDAARHANAAGDRVLLFLLDEILHGTNTTERQIAARRIIRFLLDQGATGAVSTHDLTLADDPAMIAAATLVHFTETFARGPDGPVMLFDYKLRPGIATSTNALKLMEMVGLTFGDSDDSDHGRLR